MKRTIHSISSVFLLLLLGTWAQAQVFIVNDLNSASLPTGWVSVGNHSTSTTTPCEGSYSVRTNRYSFSTSGTLTTASGVSNGNDISFSFSYKVINYSGGAATSGNWGSVALQYSVNGGAFTTFHTINEGNHVPSTSCAVVTQTIPGASVPQGASVQFRWASAWATGDWYLYIDQVFIASQVACPQPLALSASGMTTNTADLSWTPGGSEASWQVEFGASGFAQGTGTTVSAGSNPYTLTGLSSNTTYSYYVRANCSGEYSGWSGPFSFTTACGVVSAFSENFDSYATGSIAPNCWARLVSGTGSLSISSTSPASGTRNIYQYSSSTANSTIMVMPEVDNIHLGTHRLRLKVRVSSGTGALNVGYVTDRTNAATFVTVQALSITNTSYGAETFVNFPNTVPAGAHLAIQNPGTSTASHYWDDVNWELIPSCPWPILASATVTSSSSATLAWTAGGTEPAWQIQWGPVGFTLGTGTMVGPMNSNPYVLSGLNSNTAYSYYVRSVCSSSQFSTWTGPINFTTPCNPYNVPYAEGFESGYTDALAIGGCLSQASEVGTGSWMANSSQTTYNRTPRTGSFNATLIYSNTDWLFIPINLNGGTSYTAEAFARQDGATATDASITIAYGTSPSAAAMTTGIVPATNLLNGSYQQFIGQFTPASSGLYYVGIRGFMNSAPWYISLDDIAIYQTPACPGPTNLTAGSITDNSASLAWNPGGSEPTWRIQWGPTGFALGSGTQVVANSDPYTLGDLSPSTTYDFYVRANCGSGNFSTWEGPYTFTTDCSGVTAFSQNFDAVTTPNLPNCWSSVVRNSTSAFASVTTVSSTGSSLPNMVSLYNAGTTTGDVMLVSPRLSNLAAGTHQLRFSARNSTSTQDLIIGTLSNDGTFTAFDTIDLSTTFAEYIVNFSTYAGTDRKIAFRRMLSSTFTYVYIDDVNWEAIPSCPWPTAASGAASGFSSASLTWTAGGSEQLWDIEWGADGFAQGTGTTVSNVSATTYALGGLTSGSSYDFYVRANCGGGDYSPWVGPYSFSINYCTPAPSSVDGTGITNVTMGTINNTTGAEPGNYGNYSAMVADAQQAAELPISITLATGYTYNMWAWVDWNNDLSFTGANEVYYLGEAPSTNPTVFTASILVPLEASLGSHRIRIGGADNGLGTTPPSNPCYTDAYGTFEDYTLNVTPAPSCLPPVQLTASNISHNSAALGWTNIGAAPAFRIQWGPTGFVLGSGTQVVASGNPHTLSGLAPVTTYDFYVRANCGSGNFSSWVGPFTFTTGCAPVSSFTENFDSYATGTIAPDCWRRLVSGSGSLSISSTTPASGTRNIYQYSFGTANSTIMVMAPVDNIHLGTYRLRFKARVGSGTGALNVGYVTDRANPATFVTVQALTITNTSYGAETIVNFPNTVPAGAHLAIQNPGTSSALHYWDDVNWEAIPSCPSPMSAVASLLGFNAAQLAWTPGSDETMWDIEWGLAGFAQGSGTSVAASSNPYVLSGLDAETSYSYYVRANCGEGDVSTWVGPISFFTGYCTPAPSSVDANGITNVTMGSINNTTGVETGNYGDYTAQTTVITSGTDLPISITYATGYTYNTWAWVDWNGNLSFTDAGEVYYLGESSAANPTTLSSSIAIPADLSAGDYRIRIGGADSGLGSTPPSNPCYTGTWAAFEDYTLVVLPPCYAPSALTAVSGANGTSATLSWTAGGDEGAWDIQWGEEGFELGSGFMAEVASNPYLLQELEGSTDYEYYVRANCGAGSYSDWAGPFAFTTPCAIPGAPLIVMQSPNSVYVDWEDVNGAQTYHLLWRQVGPGVPFVRINVQRSAGTLTGLTPGAGHAIRLRSKCGPGNSATDLSGTSATYSFNTPTGTGTCGMTSIAVIDSAAANRVRVYWGYVPGATQYRVQFRQVGQTIWQSRTSTEANVFINGIVPGIAYEYRVNVTCPTGETAYSAIFTYTLNGTAVSSRPLADILDEEAIANDISLYPNPTSGLLYIELGAGAKYEQLQLFNVAGQRILAQDLAQDSERSELDMSGLPDGLYLIQLMGTSDSALMKVMLQR